MNKTTPANRKGVFVAVMVSLAVVLSALGPGPKYEEVLVLVMNTLLLLPAVVAVGWCSRSFLTSSVSTALALALIWWTGILWVAIQYAYPFSAMKSAWSLSLLPIVAGAALACVLTGLSRLVNPRRRRSAGCCEGCGYNLAGNVSGICPECGRAIRPTEQPKEAR